MAIAGQNEKPTFSPSITLPALGKGLCVKFVAIPQYEHTE